MENKNVGHHLVGAFFPYSSGGSWIGLASIKRKKIIRQFFIRVFYSQFVIYLL